MKTIKITDEILRNLLFNLSQLRDYAKLVKGKEIAPTLGDTGVGKSTFLGMLISKCIKFYFDNIGSLVMDRNGFTGRLPENSSSTQSHTLFCDVFKPEDVNETLRDLFIVDSSGNNDNGKLDTVIPAKIGLRYALKQARAIKSIMILFDYQGTIHRDRGIDVDRNLPIIDELLQNLPDDEWKSLIFVFNRAYHIQPEFNNEEKLMEALKCKLSGRDKSNVAQYMANHPEQIVLITNDYSSVRNKVFNIMTQLKTNISFENLNFNSTTDSNYDNMVDILHNYIEYMDNLVKKYINHEDKIKSLLISRDNIESQVEALTVAIIEGNDETEQKLSFVKANEAAIEKKRDAIKKLEEETTKIDNDTSLLNDQLKRIETDEKVEVKHFYESFKRAYFDKRKAEIIFNARNSYPIYVSEVCSGKLIVQPSHNEDKGCYNKIYEILRWGEKFEYDIFIQQQKKHVESSAIFNKKAELFEKDSRRKLIERDITIITKEIDNLDSEIKDIDNKKLVQLVSDNKTRINNLNNDLSEVEKQLKMLLEDVIVRHFLEYHAKTKSTLKYLKKIIVGYREELFKNKNESANSLMQQIERFKEIDFMEYRKKILDTEEWEYEKYEFDEFSASISESKPEHVSESGVQKLKNVGHEIKSWIDKYKPVPTLPNSVVGLSCPAVFHTSSNTKDSVQNKTTKLVEMKDMSCMDCVTLVKYLESHKLKMGISESNFGALIKFLVEEEFDGLSFLNLDVNTLTAANIKKGPCVSIIAFAQKHQQIQ